MTKSAELMKKCIEEARTIYREQFGRGGAYYDNIVKIALSLFMQETKPKLEDMKFGR